MKILYSLFFIFLSLGSSAQLRLSAIFSDHMILQRDKPVKIWGTTKAGETVRVSIGKEKGTAHADVNGQWMITLPSFAAGGPYTVQIESAGTTKMFSDVLF